VATVADPRPPEPRAEPHRQRTREILLVIALLGIAFWLRWFIGRGWTFAGSDSYAYLGAARELAENHRYAFRLPDWYPDHAVVRPLGYCRLPGYPIFLSVVAFLTHRGWPALGAYELIFSRVKAPQAALDVLSCLIVYLLARRLAGRRSALIALSAAALCPPLLMFSNAVLTETLATTLSTLSLGLLALVVLPTEASGERLRHRVWIAAAVVLALGCLVRIDTVFLLPLLLLPVLRFGCQALRYLPGVALAFALAYAPWPLRNQISLGHPHPLGGQCDVRGDAMPHTSFFAWFATWVTRESQTPGTLYCLFRRECVASASTYPPEAFDSPAERATLQTLLDLRNREGMSERVDAGFRQLALARLRAHPFRTLIWLPLQRAFYLWATPIDQPLRATMRLPGPQFVSYVKMPILYMQILILGLGLFGLVRSARRPRLRPFALLAGAALALRTGSLAAIGFVENRYVIELLPLLLVLVGVALAAPETLAKLGAEKPKVDG
jgi:4-amino-4-deoxy-L-arabinose transferase-like glycosyltransferase